MNPTEFNQRRAALQARFAYQFINLPWAAHDLPPGWFGLLERLCEAVDKVLEAEDRQAFTWTQIKEKYGYLCAYYSSPKYALIEPLITAAEYESERTCQVCGGKGISTEVNGWVRTLCPDHYIFGQQTVQRPAEIDQNYLRALAESFGVYESTWSLEIRDSRYWAVCCGVQKVSRNHTELDALKNVAEKHLSMPVEIIT
jgi:hypothetical protein